MFTGIVQGIGRVEALHDGARDRELRLRGPEEIVSKLSIGASIALDGVCQTVTELARDAFTVHAIAETLRVTTLGELQVGHEVNLEAALGAGDALGGHFVQGHVDGLARIVRIESAGDSMAYTFESEPALVRQLVPKGSVALDGISLTVGPRVEERRFEVYLIPHTLDVTTLGRKREGARVNLETDILGKYILRYLTQGRGEGLEMADLHRAGFGGGAS